MRVNSERKSSGKVSSNIRKNSILLCMLLSFFSATTLAQSSSEEALVQAMNEQETSPQKAALQSVSQSPPNTTSEQPILRLEDTIRGNKEQPQVLTIVPWQLPVHQRINENTEWQLQASQLSSIERNAFLRNLAVVKEIKAAQKANVPASSVNQDD